MATYAQVGDHLGMVYDDIRNAAYAKAIREWVTPDSVVLDLGAGLGIHGLLAAQCGARKVYMVDSSPVLGVAEEIAAKNGLADRCIWLRKNIEDVELPEKVDLIISVFTGNFLLLEDLLPALFFARDKFLKPSGKLLPERGSMFAAPVSAARFHQKHIGDWARPAWGFSFEAARALAANQIYCDRYQNIDAQALAAPIRLAELNYHTATKAECRSAVTFETEAGGECHGFLGWFDLQLGGSTLSTGADAPSTHWSPAFLPVEPPLRITPGTSISFKLLHPQSGDWTWVVRHGQESRQHSTFFSRKPDLAILQRHSRHHKPVLSERGALVDFVVSRMTGQNAVEKILEDAFKRFGERFPSRDALEERVLSIITRLGE